MSNLYNKSYYFFSTIVLGETQDGASAIYHPDRILYGFFFFPKLKLYLHHDLGAERLLKWIKVSN